MILGQGNVALDVARILLTPPEHLEVRGQSGAEGWRWEHDEERLPLPVQFRSHLSKQPLACLLQESGQTSSRVRVPLHLRTDPPVWNVWTDLLLVKN